MTTPSKYKQPRKSASKASDKQTAGENVYTFTKDRMKIRAKNYADALRKRNKMITSAPKSKSMGDEEKGEE